MMQAYFKSLYRRTMREAYAAAIQENQDAGVFFESAATSDQILSKITGICTRIFNRNRLQVDAASQTVSFDVPMSELVVFAQGENVNIEGIADSSGKKYKMSADQVKIWVESWKSRL